MMKFFLRQSSLFLLIFVPFLQAATVPIIDGVVSVPGNMRLVSDEGLGEIVARGLIVSDKIGGNELLGGGNDYSTPFTFYRMGIDGELALNMNIAKMQLGCGGINDYLTGVQGCDIDMDYVSLMGLNSAGDGPGAPLSEFSFKRPYLELAIKNDNTSTRREVVGIKIGAQSVSGAIAVGRQYANGATNQENMNVRNINDRVNGGTARPDNVCRSGDSVGGGVVGCHSGINTASGFLGTELSLQMRVIASVCGGGLVSGVCVGVPIGLDAWGCIGRLDQPECRNYNSPPLYADVAGTRMSGLGLRAANLDLSGNGLSGILTGILGNAYASLDADLRLVHKLVMDDTSDFFLSFQREPVAYPRYNKIPALNSDGTVRDTSLTDDACLSASFRTARCLSAYSVPANTGWWINAPAVKLTNVKNDDAQLGLISLGNALDLLAPPGLKIDQADFKIPRVSNCHGSAVFC